MSVLMKKDITLVNMSVNFLSGDKLFYNLIFYTCKF